MNVDREDELRIQAPPGAASASESRLQLDGTGLMPEAQCEVQGEKDLRSRFQPALTQCQLTGSASDGPRKLEPPNETSAIIPLQPARRARRGHHGDLMLRELANRSRGRSAGTETVGREQADVLRREADGQQGSTQKGDEAPVAEELVRILRRAVVVHRAEHEARLEVVLATEQIPSTIDN